MHAMYEELSYVKENKLSLILEVKWVKVRNLMPSQEKLGEDKEKCWFILKLEKFS